MITLEGPETVDWVPSRDATPGAVGVDRPAVSLWGNDPIWPSALVPGVVAPMT